MNIQYVVVVGFDMKPLITPTNQRFFIPLKTCDIIILKQGWWFRLTAMQWRKTVPKPIWISQSYHNSEG
jgi:hypothetical protein